MIQVGITAQTAYRDDRMLTASANVIGDDASCAPDRLLHPLGLQSRPRSPQVDSTSGEVQAGAVLLYWYEGSTLHALAADDERRSVKLPTLEEGSTVVYADRDGLTIKLNASTGAIDIDAPQGAIITSKVAGGAKVEVSASHVKVGDDTALPLAMGAALAKLWALLAADAVGIDAAVLAATGSAPPQPLSAFFSANAAEKLQTTIAEGT